MAQRVITQLVSDLSGEDIADGEGQTVRFGWLGTDYTIDLTEEEADEFAEALEPYLSAAAKASGQRRRTRRAPSAAKAEAAGSPDTRDVRAWANANGWKVSSRGRIPSEVLEAYKSAN